MKNPYKVIKSRYVTEKVTVLEQLKGSDSNRCVSRCTSPKYVFIVDLQVNKREIAQAVELIYKDQKIKVTKVNTILMKGKPKKKGRGRRGYTSQFKKAIVTMEEGDSIDNI